MNDSDVKSKEEKVEKEAKGEPSLVIQTIYVKDVSFESPNTPAIFTAKWAPELSLNVDINSNRLEDDKHEIVLKVNATVKNDGKTAFLVEIKQAGIFILKSFPKEQLHYMLGSFCPNILFPYAREIISDIVMRGGLPPLYLAPINFDALYHQRFTKKEERDRPQ